MSRDSWTLEKISPCYWPDGFISVNNKVYIYANGSWIERPPTIHLHNLHLIEKFDEIEDHLPNYSLSPHPHDNRGLEPLNVISEIVARIQSSNTDSLSTVIVNAHAESNWWDITSWLGSIKKIFVSILIFGIFFLILYLTWKCGLISLIFSSLLSCCCKCCCS